MLLRVALPSRFFFWCTRGLVQYTAISHRSNSHGLWSCCTRICLLLCLHLYYNLRAQTEYGNIHLRAQYCTAYARREISGCRTIALAFLYYFAVLLSKILYICLSPWLIMCVSSSWWHRALLKLGMKLEISLIDWHLLIYWGSSPHVLNVSPKIYEILPKPEKLYLFLLKFENQRSVHTILYDTFVIRNDMFRTRVKIQCVIWTKWRYGTACCRHSM